MTTKMAISRRQFLGSTGALGFAFGLPSFAASTSDTSAPLRPNAWVRIHSDGAIVIQSGISELGQGSMTTLALLVAEELDADWSKVRIEMSPAVDELYGNPRLGNLMVTIASFGVMGYYTALRLAGAKARASLMQAVADRWKVPVSELATEPSAVVHRSSKKRMTYGQIAKTVRSLPQPPELKEADLKPATRFRLVGNDVQ